MEWSPSNPSVLTHITMGPLSTGETLCGPSTMPEVNRPPFPPKKRGKKTCHAHVLLHCPDIITLQEVGMHMSDLWHYTSHILDCANGSSKGLVTYVKQGAPVTF